MTTIAVTGHMDLTDASVPLVRAALAEALVPHTGGLVGMSCIAKGSDSLFAEAVLEAGGRLVVVIPSQDYRERKVRPEHAETFDRLVKAADEVVVLPHETANRQAYEAANSVLLERADRLVAVWNGEPPTGKGGGTADTVREARTAGVPVDRIWPDGAARRG
ncbi:hypothetical protein GT204_16910 [Streptomyces sp. SID4919]|uniref:hypothetical protein n=1 Tax=unclassified Streptomyces TaxID=2593676 RepID=UPI000823ABB3|nr:MULTISPECIES: hypothetical protein [unclassified Streptomyces]MYY10541.1 hypothetical protein [Streptomyces sp. SID4919]SCK47265.1 hypothetical protein YW7DRAFT_04219 [Streptomyces sp. AmelKG-E11A]